MEANYIGLNFPNFITVCLMAAVGVFVLGFVTRGVKSAAGVE